VSKLAIEHVSRTFPGVHRGAPTRALEPIDRFGDRRRSYAEMLREVARRDR